MCPVWKCLTQVWLCAVSALDPELGLRFVFSLVMKHAVTNLDTLLFLWFCMWVHASVSESRCVLVQLKLYMAVLNFSAQLTPLLSTRTALLSGTFCDSSVLLHWPFNNKATSHTWLWAFANVASATEELNFLQLILINLNVNSYKWLLYETMQPQTMPMFLMTPEIMIMGLKKILLTPAMF